MQNTNQSWEEVLCRPWGFEQIGTAKEGSFSRFYSRSKTWLCDRRQNTRGRNENVCLLFLSFFFFCSQVDKLAKCPSLSFWNVLNEQSKFLFAPKVHPSWKKFLHHSSSSGAESQCFWQGIISNCAEEVGHLAPDRKKGCLIGGGVKGNYKKRHLFIYHCHFELREWALLSLPHIFRCGATCLDGNIASRCCCCWQSSPFSFPLLRWQGWHRVGWMSYCVVLFFC